MKPCETSLKFKFSFPFAKNFVYKKRAHKLLKQTFKAVIYLKTVAEAVQYLTIKITRKTFRK